jgi:hypothetical protein
MASSSTRRKAVKIPNEPPGFVTDVIAYPGQPKEIKVSELPHRSVTTARTFVRKVPATPSNAMKRERQEKIIPDPREHRGELLPSTQDVLDDVRVPDASCQSCGGSLHYSSAALVKKGDSLLYPSEQMKIGSKALLYSKRLQDELPKIIVQYIPWTWAIRGFDDNYQPYHLPPDAISSFLKQSEARIAAFYAKYPDVEGRVPFPERMKEVAEKVVDIYKQISFSEDLIPYEKDLLSRELQLLAIDDTQMTVGTIFAELDVPARECCRQQIANDARSRFGMESRDANHAFSFIAALPWEMNQFRQTYQG